MGLLPSLSPPSAGPSRGAPAGRCTGGRSFGSRTACHLAPYQDLSTTRISGNEDPAYVRVSHNLFYPAVPAEGLAEIAVYCMAADDQWDAGRVGRNAEQDHGLTFGHGADLTLTQVEIKAMSSGNARPMGFSRLEIAFILVLIALVGIPAVTQFLDLSLTARQSVDQGVIAAVRKGIADYAQAARNFDRLPIYPPLLDRADTGAATPRNPFFTEVIEDGLAVSGWLKTGPHSYRGPKGELLNYDAQTGDFGTAPHDADAGAPGAAQSPQPAAEEE